MYDASHSIRDFLEGAAAKQPAPGGGSVTALVGALAASMGEMVVNYSIGKKTLAAHAAEHPLALAELARARSLMLQLMAEDQAAYEAMTALRKLPADSTERQSKYAPTLLACIRIPETIAATGLAVLELADRLVDKVNLFLLSDLAVCAELAMATVRCGIYNVRVNMADVTDESDRQTMQHTIDAMLARGTGLIREVIPRIWQRNLHGGQP